MDTFYFLLIIFTGLFFFLNVEYSYADDGVQLGTLPAILTLPLELNVDDSVFLWHQCPNEGGILGFQAIFGDYDHGEVQGLKGLRGFCGHPFSNNRTLIEFEVEHETGGIYEDAVNCSTGVVVGLRLRLHNERVVNLVVQCMDVQTGRIEILPGKGQLQGILTETVRCNVPTDFICGFQAAHTDSLLSGIRMKCCGSPKPVNYEDEVTGNNLTVPAPTDWGQWFNWEHCPPDSYVVGFKLKLITEEETRDKVGLTGIKLICLALDEVSNENHFLGITSGESYLGFYREEFICNGVALGVALRSQAPQGATVDDAAATNFAMYCSSPDADLYDLIEGDGASDGDWTDPQMCEENQIICGLRTQVEIMVPHVNKFNKTDRVGLNNIMIKCCDVEPSLMEKIRIASSRPEKSDEIPERIPTYAEVSGKILASKPVTNFGTWAECETCPLGTYVVGIQLKTQVSSSDQEGLTGIRLFCSEHNGRDVAKNKVNSDPGRNDLAQISSGMSLTGSFGKSSFCKGIAIGFQLKVESYQGPFGDDTATNGVRLVCADIENGESYKLEGQGGEHGSWREEHHCPFGEVLCGIQTQVDLGLSEDKTGINRVIMKCCDLEQAALLALENSHLLLNSSTQHDLMRNTHKYSNGEILRSPRVLDLGQWFEGEFCPLTTRVVGFQVSKYQFTDSGGKYRNLVSGIHLFCLLPDSNATESKLVYVISSGSLPEIGRLSGRPKFCSNGSYGTGLSFELENDELNINNVYMHCGNANNTNQEMLSSASGSLYSVQFDPMICTQGEFLCGIQTQVFFSNLTRPRNRNGVKNANIKCCSEEKQFRNVPLTKDKNSRKTVPDGKILKAPHSSHVGIPDSWNNCTSGNIVGGFSLKYSNAMDDLTGLRIICVDSNGRKTRSITLKDRQALSTGTYGNEVTCGLNALPVGFQLRSKAYFGEGEHTTMEATDFRLICQRDFDVYVIQAQPLLETTEDDRGFWTGFQRCDAGQVLCGIRGSFDSTGEIAAGLETIQMKCCDFTIGTNSALNFLEEDFRTHKGVSVFSKSLELSSDHQWSQWDHCSRGSYAVGSSLKYSSNGQIVTGIQLKCGRPEDFSAELEFIGRMEGPIGEYYHQERTCTGGAAIGFQTTHSSRYIQNVRLFCSQVYESKNSTEDSRIPWHAMSADTPKFCPKGYAICGFRTLMDTWRSTGVLGLTLKCCPVPHPATVCNFRENWERIAVYDAFSAIAFTSYTYTENTGVSFTRLRSSSERWEKSFAESMGFEVGLSKNIEVSEQLSQSVGEDSQVSHTKGHEKSKTVSEALEKSMSRSSTREDSTTRSRTEDHSTSNTRHSQNTFGAEMGMSIGASVTAGVNFLFASASATLSTEFRASSSFSRTSGSSDTVDMGQSHTEATSSSTSNSETEGRSKSNSWAETSGESEALTSSKGKSMSWGQSKGLSSSSGESSSRRTDSNRGTTTGVDWTNSIATVLTEEKSHSTLLEIPPGTRTTLYQAVGYCSFYTVRTKVFKRVDEERQEPMDYAKIYFAKYLECKTSRNNSNF